MQPCYLGEYLVILHCSTKNKMATQIPTGYGPRAAKLFFDGDESKYEL